MSIGLARLALCYLTRVVRLGVLLPLAAATALSAADPWNLYRAEPIEVWTNAKPDSARDVLATLDQLRHTMARLLGRQEIQPLWPVRIVVWKPGSQKLDASARVLKLRRDAYMAAIPAGEPVPDAWLREFARLLIRDNVERMPDSIENGLVDLLSSFESKGAMTTLGKPPRGAAPNRDWARVHLLTTDPEYAGRSRVFFSNLQKGAALDTAYRNGFEKTAPEMEAVVDRYYSGGRFEPREIAGKPLNPERDYRPRPVSQVRAAVAIADLMEGEAARKAYLAVINESAAHADAYEGVGMFDKAIEHGSENARAWVGHALALKDKDAEKAKESLRRAMQLNPRWAEPHAQFAPLMKTAEGKVAPLKKAAELEPRNLSYWQVLAEAQIAAKDYAAANESWRAAERAANDADKPKIAALRKQYEDRRLELAAAEQARQEEERRRELERVRNEAEKNIREAEAKANAKLGPLDSKAKVVDWWDGPKPDGVAQGDLLRVDCQRGVARMVVRIEGGKLAQYAVRDAGKVAIVGGSEQTLGCGVQRKPRKVKLEFVGKADPKLGTLGDVLTVEFVH